MIKAIYCSNGGYCVLESQSSYVHIITQTGRPIYRRKRQDSLDWTVNLEDMTTKDQSA